jgi:hypothetical protein
MTDSALKANEQTTEVREADEPTADDLIHQALTRLAGEVDLIITASDIPDLMEVLVREGFSHLAEQIAEYIQPVDR